MAAVQKACATATSSRPLREIDPGFAGRKSVDDPLHRRLAALTVGDTLQFEAYEGGYRLLTREGRSVGRLSSKPPPAGLRCVGATVRAVVVWRRGDTPPEYLDRCRCKQWEVVCRNWFSLPDIRALRERPASSQPPTGCEVFRINRPNPPHAGLGSPEQRLYRSRQRSGTAPHTRASRPITIHVCSRQGRPIRGLVSSTPMAATIRVYPRHVFDLILIEVIKNPVEILPNPGASSMRDTLLRQLARRRTLHRLADHTPSR